MLQKRKCSHQKRQIWQVGIDFSGGLHHLARDFRLSCYCAGLQERQLKRTEWGESAEKDMTTFSSTWLFVHSEDESLSGSKKVIVGGRSEKNKSNFMLGLPKEVILQAHLTVRCYKSKFASTPGHTYSQRWQCIRFAFSWDFLMVAHFFMTYLSHY